MNPLSERWPLTLVSLAGLLLIWCGLWVRRKAGRTELAGGVLSGLGLLCLAAAMIHVLFWDSFTGACYGWLAILFLVTRLQGFLLVVLGLGTAAGIYHHFRRSPETVTGLVVAANLVALWYITVALMLLLDGRVDGRMAGNQAMAVAAAWALYGLGLFLVERRFPDQRLRHGIRFLLVAALGYLIVGALPGNARWATPWVRIAAYAAVLGSIGGVELAYRHYGTDGETRGLLAFAAAVAGFFIIHFETERWLEPLFTLPPGQWLTAEGLRWEESTQAFTRVALWAVYAWGLLWTGEKLHSPSTRVLALGVYAFTVAAAAVAAPDATAAPWLRLLAIALLCPVPVLLFRKAHRPNGWKVTGPPFGWR